MTELVQIKKKIKPVLLWYIHKIKYHSTMKKKDQIIDTYNMMNLDMTFKYLLLSNYSIDGNINSTKKKNRKQCLNELI